MAHVENRVITKIYYKSDSQNIFEGDGPKAQPSGSWKGKVRNDTKGS